MKQTIKIEVPEDKKAVWKNDYVVNLLRKANITLMLKALYSNQTNNHKCI